MIKHILLIDDDEDEHQFFQWAAKKINHPLSITHTYCATEAFDILSRSLPDIIFLDIQLRGASGFLILEEIRKSVSFATIPLFMYSTVINESNIKKALLLGATGCIRKTSDMNALATCLTNLLEGDTRNQLVVI